MTHDGNDWGCAHGSIGPFHVFSVERVERKLFQSPAWRVLSWQPVWVAEWEKKARGLNIAYKVLALFLSVCPQNRNTLLPLLRTDLQFSTRWGECLESDCFLNRFSNNFPVFKPPHPPNFQKYLGQPIPGPFGGFTCELGCSSTFFIACLGFSQLPFFVGCIWFPIF